MDNFGFASKNKIELQELVLEPKLKKVKLDPSVKKMATRSQGKDKDEAGATKETEEARKQEMDKATKKWKAIAKQHRKHKARSDDQLEKDHRLIMSTYLNIVTLALELRIVDQTLNFFYNTIAASSI